MSVLEKFFQIGMLLTVMLFGINIFVTIVSPALTGEPLSEGLDVNGLQTVTTTTGNEIRQITGEPDTPTTGTATWDEIWNQFLNVTVGYRQIFDSIFAKIEPDTTGDFSESIGTMLNNILTLFQVVGGAYIIWALVSAWKGGGSP